jgi:hypothetical protein
MGLGQLRAVMHLPLCRPIAQGLFALMALQVASNPNGRTWWDG